MSRHRLIRPEILKPSQFRIRAPKEDTIQASTSNYGSIYPIHSFVSDQFHYKMIINIKISQAIYLIEKSRI